MSEVIDNRTPPKDDRSRAPTPMEMLNQAFSSGADMDKLDRLMALQQRWESAQAKRAYVVAFASFKKNPPDVVTDMLNSQYNNSNYSSLANLVNTVNQFLGENGLNANWSIDQSNGVSVTCILSHIDGHSEKVTLCGPLDDSGSKNKLQQLKSTLTYLEGATFQAITGVVARSVSTDDDGEGASPKNTEPHLSPEEEATPFITMIDVAKSEELSALPGKIQTAAQEKKLSERAFNLIKAHYSARLRREKEMQNGD